MRRCVGISVRPGVPGLWEPDPLSTLRAERQEAVQWDVGTWVSAMEVPAVGTLQPASIGMRFMAGKTLYRP